MTGPQATRAEGGWKGDRGEGEEDGDGEAPFLSLAGLPVTQVLPSITL